MDVWFAKGVVLGASVAMVAIRAPHGQRSMKVPVETDRKGPLEFALLAFAWLAFFLPLAWVASPLLSFADTPLRPIPFALGTLGVAGGLALFRRSHIDLGTNWSISLELREGHRLVREGIYRRVRHPMYLSLLVYSLGQWLLLPNRIAGPSYLVAMALLVAFRLGPEERMMRDHFGPAYDDYARRSSRLFPGVW